MPRTKATHGLTPQVYGWPELNNNEAMCGLAGQVVAAGAYTNIDLPGLLMAFLTCASSSFGDTYIHVGDEYHPVRLFTTMVGRELACRRAVEHAKRFFTVSNNSSMPSASKLSKQKNKYAPINIESYPLEQVKDFSRALTAKNNSEILFYVEEFGCTLLAAKSIHNPLAFCLSSAWDSTEINMITRSREQFYLEANVCLLGQVPLEELRNSMPEYTRLNKLVSKILWTCVKPTANQLNIADSPEEMDPVLKGRLCLQLAQAVKNRPKYISLSPKSQALWRELKEQLLLQETTGIIGTMSEIADYHVLRLAAVYGLLDESLDVLPCHLEAAMAVWRYCKDSARLIFVENKIETIALRILNVLKTSTKTQTQLHAAFGNNVVGKELDRSLAELESRGLIKSIRSGGGHCKGRPTTAWSLA